MSPSRTPLGGVIIKQLFFHISYRAHTGPPLQTQEGHSATQLIAADGERRRVGAQLPEACPAANQLAEALYKPGVRQVGKEPTRMLPRPPRTGPRPPSPAQKKWTSYPCGDDDDEHLMHI